MNGVVEETIYVGKLIKEINIESIEPIYIDTVKIMSKISRHYFYKPLCVFNMNNDIYFGIYEHTFTIFGGGFEDWPDFSPFFPTMKEFNKLQEYNPSYYLMDIPETLKDLDEFSEFQLDLIKQHNRNNILNKIINNKPI